MYIMYVLNILHKWFVSVVISAQVGIKIIAIIEEPYNL